MSDVQLTECTGWEAVVVRGAPTGAVAAELGVPQGRAVPHPGGALVAGMAPGHWCLLGPAGSTGPLAGRLESLADDELTSVVDVTHGRLLVRLTGASAAPALAALCALDLSATTDGTALRTLVAGVAATIVRDDRNGVPSYLLQCDRSYGRYLTSVLADALHAGSRQD